MGIIVRNIISDIETDERTGVDNLNSVRSVIICRITHEFGIEPSGLVEINPVKAIGTCVVPLEICVGGTDKWKTILGVIRCIIRIEFIISGIQKADSIPFIVICVILTHIVEGWICERDTVVAVVVGDIPGKSTFIRITELDPILLVITGIIPLDIDFIRIYEMNTIQSIGGRIILSQIRWDKERGGPVVKMNPVILVIIRIVSGQVESDWAGYKETILAIIICNVPGHVVINRTGKTEPATPRVIARIVADKIIGTWIGPLDPILLVIRCIVLSDGEVVGPGKINPIQPVEIRIIAGNVGIYRTGNINSIPRIVTRIISK